ncbi:MAG: glycosyltransferase [Rhodocyclales bacterium]|nr:glycosyltransferase [Rhodocyclales bacterium]
MPSPLITIAIPSFNQGRFLNEALASIFSQEILVEVFVLDAGSSDNSLAIINKWANKLAGWRSYSDEGQAAAINEGIANGRAPYVCWLNSDDFYLPNGLLKMVSELDKNPDASAIYGRTWNMRQKSEGRRPAWVEAFDEHRLALRCIISQPGTLIRRNAWEAVGGVDSQMQMCMDYDLWWRLYKQIGPLLFFDDFVAVNREHASTKTNTRRRDHYREAIATVRRYYGHAPLKWWLAQPYAVWFKSIL